MRVSKNKQGYTILEVLIFLAISSFMFLIAASAVSGKQAKAEFKQGIQAANEHIRQTINDVSNGYFPSNSDFSCNATVGAQPQFTTATQKQQGENLNCIFLGKVIHFSPDGDNTKTKVYTLAGRQFIGADMTSGTPTSLAQALPKVVYDAGAGVDLTETKGYEWGISLNSVNSAAGNVRAIAFTKSFVTDSSGNITSGSQDVTVTPIYNSEAGAATSAMISYLDSASFRSKLAVAQPNIILCFGEGSQYGSIALGGSSGQRQATDIRISDGAGAVGC